MGVFLGHHRNIDRVDDGTKNENDSFFVDVHLHHIHKCSLNRAIRSPITRLSHLSYLSPRPCYSIILEKWQRKVTTSMESWSPLEAFAGNQSVPFPQPLWYFVYSFFKLCNRRGGLRLN
nr:hypothetical protein [Solanum melongena]WMB96753.1 hypothetical protein [Solanum melongena]WMB96875.1 hypothetical protein [Solanum melongena]WMB97065.1 hypothetical protein [Solanum aethiopicum]